MLKINNIQYKRSELLQLSASKLKSDDTLSWEKDIYTFIQEWLNKKDHIVVKTSGSTGEPKSIELKKEWVKYSAQQTCNFFNLNSKSTALLCLPSAYIAGKMMIVRAFVSGMNLITVEPTSNPFQTSYQPDNRQAIQSSPRAESRGIQPFDFAAITPFQLSQSLESLKVNPIVKTIIVGGGEINPVLETEIQNISVDIYATYGMTETSSHIALRKVNSTDKKDYYTVIGDTKIRLDSRECLTITNQYLFDGELITNDIVEIIINNRFRWIGRIDNVINSGGVKIMPEEIEQTIGNIIPQNFAISSIPHNTLGEEVVLVVECDQMSNDEKNYLLSQLKNLVHSYSIPKHIYTLTEIPKTLTGKVDRNAIKERIKKAIQHDTFL